MNYGTEVLGGLGYERTSRIMNIYGQCHWLCVE